MFSYALKSFLHDKTKLLIAVTGIAFSLVLILLIYGIFKGTEKQVVAYIENTEADVWIMQKGVSNMHMSNSVFPEYYLDKIRKEKGVHEVYKIFYVASVLKVVGQDYFAYFLGYDPAKAASGPWKMAEGDKTLGLNEVIIDRKIAQENKLKVGEEIEFMGQKLKIAGLSDETFSMANSFVFLDFRKLQRLLGGEKPKITSFLIVDLKEGEDARQFANKVKQEYPELNALTKAKFLGSEGRLIKKMGIETI